MTIRTTVPRAALVVGLSIACVWLAPGDAVAADREHQQLMADLRMLQEQTQQLQMLLNGLGEALKAVNSRLDDQTSLERKAFADGKVQMDAISGDLRIVRERVDETNVRLGTISQELESVRQAIPEQWAAPAAPPSTDATAPTTSGGPPVAAGSPAVPSPPAAPSAQTNPGIQPQRLWQSSYGDYASGNYSLAIEGFQSYLKYFPKSVQAHEAQLYIGEAFFFEKKVAEAVSAYERVIADFATSSSVPQVYYKRGVALEALGDVARARESYEAVIKQFPESPQATLAKQRLNSVNRPAR